LRGLPSPKPGRGDIGAVAQRAELRPDGIFGDPLPADAGAEAALDAGYDALAVADRGGDG
jgi:hypothetical protein